MTSEPAMHISGVQDIQLSPWEISQRSSHSRPGLGLYRVCWMYELDDSQQRR